jgi:hypothetical protein
MGRVAKVIKLANANSKLCPACKWNACWKEASVCEKCGYDFVLQKKPRAVRKIIIEELDDSELESILEAPKETSKKCPGCANVCFWQAPFCEKCEWDFIEGKAKEKPETETTAPTAIETRKLLGYIPDWLKHPHFPWMEYKGDGTPDSLKHWGREFIDGCKQLIAKEIRGEFDVYRGVVEFFVSGSKNPVLYDARFDFLTWFSPGRRGISILAHDETRKFFKVWSGIDDEATHAYRALSRLPEDWWKKSVK